MMNGIQKVTQESDLEQEDSEDCLTETGRTMTKYQDKICPPNVLNKRTMDEMVDKVNVAIPEENIR